MILGAVRFTGSLTRRGIDCIVTCTTSLGSPRLLQIAIDGTICYCDPSPGDGREGRGDLSTLMGHLIIALSGMMNEVAGEEAPVRKIEAPPLKLSLKELLFALKRTANAVAPRRVIAAMLTDLSFPDELCSTILDDALGLFLEKLRPERWDGQDLTPQLSEMMRGMVASHMEQYHVSDDIMKDQDDPLR